MKKLLFLLLVVVSFKTTAQIHHAFTVDWDTITERTVDKITVNMIKNFDYTFTTFPTGMDSNLELFYYEGVQTYPAVDDNLQKVTPMKYFEDSIINIQGHDMRKAGHGWLRVDRDSTELIRSVESIMATYNNDIFELQKQVEYLAYLAYFNYAQHNNIGTPINLDNLIPRILGYITDWWKNRANANAKINEIRNEQNIDLNSGWTVPNAQ